MQIIDHQQLLTSINALAGSGRPFLFLIDFRAERGVVVPIEELAQRGIYCAIDGVEIGRAPVEIGGVSDFRVEPIDFEDYRRRFDQVERCINHGDSYLLNLTSATRLHGDIDMRAIYAKACACYKFMVEDQFLFYSPEPFVRIQGGKIFCFPMKGTIRSVGEDAEHQLINSEKELREHYTIVDLIRNDLSIVASDVVVERFRYVEKIQTERGEILQTSSRISGTLSDDWPNRLGDILLALLPAGSVTGAPKLRTVDIIEQVEASPRGFYTGVMGVFRNGVVDSCVNIRFLERVGDDFYYRSGGGVTSLSSVDDEYAELLTKIYVPVI